MWQEPFTWGTESEEGRWNSEQKSIGGAHVCCLPFTPPPPLPAHRRLLCNLCRRGFYFCVCIFCICVCVCVHYLFGETRTVRKRLGVGSASRTRHCCSVWNKGGRVAVRAGAWPNVQCIEEKCALSYCAQAVSIWKSTWWSCTVSTRLFKETGVVFYATMDISNRTLPCFSLIYLDWAECHKLPRLWNWTADSRLLA